jgi:hypothetical protein
VLQAFCPMVCFILHKHTHELILGCQQLLDANRCTHWRRGQWIATWGLPTSTPIAGGSLGDVRHVILGHSGMHHLPKVNYTIRYLQ